SLSGARLRGAPFLSESWHLLGLEAFYEIRTSYGRRVVRGRGGRGAGGEDTGAADGNQVLRCVEGAQSLPAGQGLADASQDHEWRSLGRAHSRRHGSEREYLGLSPLLQHRAGRG